MGSDQSAALLAQVKVKLQRSLGELQYYQNVVNNKLYSLKVQLNDIREKPEQEALTRAVLESLIKQEQLEILYEAAVMNVTNAIKDAQLFGAEKINPVVSSIIATLQVIAPKLQSESLKAFVAYMVKRYGQQGTDTVDSDILLAAQLEVDQQYLDKRFYELKYSNMKQKDIELDEMRRKLDELQ